MIPESNNDEDCNNKIIKEEIGVKKVYSSLSLVKHRDFEQNT